MSHRSHALALMTGEPAPAPDPVLVLSAAILAGPSARAALIAERIRQITGPQHQAVTCWRCEAEHPEAGDGWTAGPGGEPVCSDQDDCDERAVMAGLVPVIGDPQDGGDAA